MIHGGMYSRIKRTPFKKVKKEGRTPVAEKSRGDLIKILDSEFSFYKRAGQADANGLVRCCTCGKLAHFSEVDNGHYITRAILSTRWDERNTDPQCPKCNRFMNGLAHIFRAHLVEKHGIEEVEKLELKSRMVSGETRDTILEKITFYRAKNKELRRTFR